MGQKHSVNLVMSYCEALSGGGVLQVEEELSSITNPEEQESAAEELGVSVTVTH